MKLCLPVKEDKGINSQVSEHFGSAPYFMIIDTETLEHQTVTNTNSEHSHGMCQPLAVLSAYKFDGIVVGGIGAGALNKLTASNIKVFKTGFSNITETVKAYKENKLEQMSLNATCVGHSTHNCGNH
ncbi:MAG: NifB/NifX family molybdenum-iron cluster-binding protein [bacterium]